MGYTSERNTQILIGLLKYHGIRKIIVSPGANNVSFVASIQNDPYFEIYSCVDERSAAYIACGMAEESKEPVVISCTGATASRNYFPGLTEAFYKHLPILAVTYTQPICNIGHNIPQVIDRTVISNDIAKCSFRINMVKDELDEWNCNIKINEGLLELTRSLPGPVHFNVETIQGGSFDVKEIMGVKPIDRLLLKDKFPSLIGKVAIFIGAHSLWSKEQIESINIFCEKYNAVVFVDSTSNFPGKYTVNPALISMQQNYICNLLEPDILIHIGDISGSYFNIKPKKVFRVSLDGKLCDYYRKLRYVFEMDELEFFDKYNQEEFENNNIDSYYKKCSDEITSIYSKITELPFSNLWIAKALSERLPVNCILHLGILNSLRSFNCFPPNHFIPVYCNTGGFGIDGCISSMLGAAIASPKKLFFCLIGDLATFYDINVLGNRHIANNIRIIVINNGLGQEFKNYGHRAAQFGEQTNPYIAAAGHFGNQSKTLLKNFSTSLGFKYFSARNKSEAISVLNKICEDSISNEPILFEVFTNTEDETLALKTIVNLKSNSVGEAKQIAKSLLGTKGIDFAKRFLKK